MWVFDVFRDRYENVDIVGNASFFVVAFYFDEETYFSAGGLFDDDVNREEGLDSDIESIAHQFKLTIGGNESDKPLIFELAKPDALVELNVVELNGLAFGGAALCLVVGLVIEPQFEVRHPGQLAVRVHHSDDLRLYDVV